MVQYEFRNYFPEIARWDSRDPLGEAGGINLYAFVGNNPINWYDPSGLVPQKFSPYLNSIQKTFYEGIASGKIAETITLLEEIGMAGATKYINQAKQLVNSLSTLMEKYSAASLQCDKLASKVYDAFKALSANPQIIKITDQREYIESFVTDTGVIFSRNATHYAVKVGEMVFDALTGSNGMAYSQYTKMLEDFGIIYVIEITK